MSKYKKMLNGDDVDTAFTGAQMELTAASTKLRKHTEKNNRLCNKCLSSNSHKQSDTSLCST
eukprot:9154342-Ditylum_brightwellii.AAC.1